MSALNLRQDQTYLLSPCKKKKKKNCIYFSSKPNKNKYKMLEIVTELLEIVIVLKVRKLIVTWPRHFIFA